MDIRRAFVLWSGRRRKSGGAHFSYAVHVVYMLARFCRRDWGILVSFVQNAFSGHFLHLQSRWGMDFEVLGGAYIS